VTDTIGYAVIGAGLVGPRHAKFAQQADGAELRAICDLREDRGKALADDCGVEWVADYKTLLERDDIDVVSICLPTFLHLEVGGAAARAGKHILVEKPIETTVERAKELITTCRDHGVLFGTVFNRRFLYGTKRARQAIQNGELGDVLVADMIFKSWRSPEYYAESGWRGTWDKEGGGALINQGVHGVDLMTWLAGPIHRVQGVSRHLRHQHIEADDTTLAICEYASGAVGIIEETTSIYPPQRDRIELHGTKGTVVLENYKIVRWDIDGSEPGEPDPAESSLPGADTGTDLGHFVQVQDMINAVREGRDPVVTGEMALHSLAVVNAIYQSERDAGPIEIQTAAETEPVG
jgi:predicted dehydrogenase